MSRFGHVLGLLALLVVLAACAGKDLPPRAPGERPPETSDEAGLWMMSDDVERRLATSGHVVKDPALQQYLHQIICRLSPEYCADIRVHVVRNPHFNASMAPNGSMQVWTGLLLRAQDEAQLAAVLGHEIGHYTERHSIERWTQIIASSDAAAFFGLAAAAAGVGPAGTLGQLVALLSIYAYSRDQERQADDIGLAMLVKSGYDPHAAAEVWRGIIEEVGAGEEDAQRPSVFVSTHPRPEERMKTLEERAAALAATSGQERSAERFAGAINGRRAAWLQSLLGVRDFESNRIVLDRLIASAMNLGELKYFDGEFYRLRGEEGDGEKATAAYEMGVTIGGAAPKIYRALGQSYMRMGDNERARAAFESYLSAAPNAEDRELIEAEIKNL